MMHKKPYTAVTVHIDRLTTEEYPEFDVGGLPDLIEAIKLQDSGPSEASRALRKKLKYGNIHRQLRALTLLDALITNAGRRFQRSFADPPLLERLRIAATDPATDPDVRARLRTLFAAWAREYKDTPGLQGIAALHRQVPRARKPSAAAAPSSSSAAPAVSRIYTPSKKPKAKSAAPFNLDKEKPRLHETLAAASIASANLLNALKLLAGRPAENREVVERYEECKRLKRELQRYIQHIESEQWLGSLISSYEAVGQAMEAFEVLDREDSDSEAEWEGGKGVREGEEEEEEEEDDPDNPFGNQYEIVDPEDRADAATVRDAEGARWKVV